MLFWDEHELIEFFGVLPEVHEDSGGHTFRVERDGLRLEVTLFPDTHEALRAGEAYIDIFQAGRDEPVFSTRIKECPGCKRIKYPNGWECLEVAAPARGIFMEEQWIVPMGARIRVNPHISVELFQSEAG
ncbi:MAG TPA: hypothetical protein VF668_06080 [Pyrinomonadaceae bacterium]|jgi:hypothetical protein